MTQLTNNSTNEITMIRYSNDHKIIKIKDREFACIILMKLFTVLKAFDQSGKCESKITNF